MLSPLARRVSTAVAALAAVAGVWTAAAPGAAAASGDCPADKFCAWENSSYTGRLMIANAGDSNPNVGSGFNDKLTSYWNRTNHYITLYFDSNYRGCMITIPPGGSSAAIPTQFNDKMTSFRVGLC